MSEKHQTLDILRVTQLVIRTRKHIQCLCHRMLRRKRVYRNHRPIAGSLHRVEHKLPFIVCYPRHKSSTVYIHEELRRPAVFRHHIKAQSALLKHRSDLKLIFIIRRRIIILFFVKLNRCFIYVRGFHMPVIKHDVPHLFYCNS